MRPEIYDSTSFKAKAWRKIIERTTVSSQIWEMFDAVSYYIDWVCVLFQPTAVLAVGKCIRWLFVASEQEVKKKQVLLSRCV